MMSSPLLAKVSRGLSITLLALAFTAGVSAVRAQTDVPSWMLTDPISDVVKAVEARLAGLEAKLASVTEQLTARQSTEHELCVADDAGGRTCISKAQLDRLLKMMQSAAIEPPAQAANSVAALAEPAEAAPEPSAPETRAAAVEEPAKIETTAAPVEEPAKIETTAAPEAPRQAEQAAANTPDEDSMPTGSIPTPESQGRAQVTHPEVEVTTPSTEN